MSPVHQHFTYAARGRYAEQLRRWFAYFDRAQFHIEFAEYLFADPAPVLDRIERFLGLGPGLEREFGARNAGVKMGEMPAAARAQLREYFTEPNRDLAALLGIDPPWPTG